MDYLKVEKKDGKTIKDALSDSNILDSETKVISENNHLLFPVTDKFLALSVALKKEISATISQKDTVPERKSSFEQDLKDALGEYYDIMRRGFDIVGSIAIMEYTKDYEDKAILIAKNIMKHHKNIKSVYAKEGIHDGEFRIQGLSFLLGEDKRETFLVENGYRLFLEVGTTYFSPRLASERLRIAGLVKDNENVLVLFSGIAPYGICISKHSGANMIYCVELNPLAHEYALLNVKKNKVKNVECMNEDATKALKDFSANNIKFDRVMMPLPKTADEFFEDVIEVCKKDTIIHWYFFSDEVTLEETAKSILDEKLGKFVDFDVIQIVKVGASSPGKVRACADIIINKIIVS